MKKGKSPAEVAATPASRCKHHKRSYGGKIYYCSMGIQQHWGAKVTLKRAVLSLGLVYQSQTRIICSKTWWNVWFCSTGFPKSIVFCCGSLLCLVTAAAIGGLHPAWKTRVASRKQSQQKPASFMCNQTLLGRFTKEGRRRRKPQRCTHLHYF